MIGQLRIYTINKGMMDSWLRLFKEEVVPKAKEAGIGVHTAWVDDERTRLIWGMWIYLVHCGRGLRAAFPQNLRTAFPGPIPYQNVSHDRFLGGLSMTKN